MMVDPQFGVARVLRPFVDFEDAYEGKAITVPIMVTEGGEILDEQAGQSGYDPTLLKGLAVPFGARVTIQLPRLNGGTSPNVYPYTWQITWRMRNLFDNAQQRVPWHLPKQGAGVADAGSPRVVLPASFQTVIYPESPEPATGITNANLRTEQVRVIMATWNLPYISTAGVAQGIYQQGLFDPAVSSSIAYLPLFGNYDCHALGDELLIGVTRDSADFSGGGAAEPNWEFGVGGTDRNFSLLWTSPDVGINVLVGTAP